MSLILLKGLFLTSQRTQPIAMIKTKELMLCG